MRANHAAAPPASTHSTAAATTWTRGVSVSDTPIGVSTVSSAGRVSPWPPPDSDGNPSSTVYASQASAHVVSATDDGSARASNAPVSAPAIPPSATASSTAPPIGNPARSSCSAPTPPIAANALAASTGNPASRTAGASPKTATSR